MSDDEDELDEDPFFHCWCGATGFYDEMFDGEVFERGCGGTGTIDCICGGDFCVCHHHGEVECPGCEDCEPDDCDDFEEDYEEFYFDDE